MSLSPSEVNAIGLDELAKARARREALAGLTTWNIVALDPSTDWTGAVLLEYREDGAVRLLEMTAICGDWDDIYSFKTAPRRTDLSGVAGRIYRTSAWLRRQLISWRNESCHTFDVLAFEDVRKFGPSRGALTSEALIGATFAYLSIREIHDLPMYPIVRMSACAVTNTTSIYREPAGKTKKEQDGKRARLKAAVQEFIVEKFGLTFHPSAYSQEEIEAICDAAAVGLAAGKKLVEELKAQRAKDAQKVMRGLGGSRGPAKKAKVAA
jgi:hypothetical protein